MANACLRTKSVCLVLFSFEVFLFISPGQSHSRDHCFQSAISTLNSEISKNKHTHSKGQFGGAAGGLGLWLGKSSGNVLGATPNVCACMRVAIYQRHYRSPGWLGRTQLATGISRLCL